MIGGHRDAAREDGTERRLARIAELARQLGRVAELIEEIGGGMLIRDLAAEEPERWGLPYAALSDAQDEGAPGTVAALMAILDAALGDGDDG